MATISIGGNDYTAYASLAEADVYLAADPANFAAWEAITDDDVKGRALIGATRSIDRMGLSEEIDLQDIPDALRDATALFAALIASRSRLALWTFSSSGRMRTTNCHCPLMSMPSSRKAN